MGKKLIGWALDYMYIVRRMVHGFFLRDDPSRLLVSSGTQKSPIILIPGVYENWQLLWPVAQRLFEHGHPVHVLEGLGYNTGTIPDMARIVAQYIEEKDVHDAIIVAHSKGGLIAKYALGGYGLMPRIRHAIAINTPFSGSKYAYLFLVPSIRTFAPKGPVVTALAKNMDVNAHITSLYSEFDPHIPEKSYLPGAENIELPLIGHFRPLSDETTLRTIMDIVRRIEGA